MLVNAVTGESEYLTEPPEWVDHVYSAELIIEQYDYYVCTTTALPTPSSAARRAPDHTMTGYNYIAAGDDV